MKFTLAYNLGSNGWADATLQDKGESYNIDSISYLSDAFTDLSQAIFDLLNGCKETSACFDHEPGQTKLRFIVSVDEVKIVVYEFKNELSHTPWEQGEIAKEFEASLNRLKSQYLEEADKVINKYGDKEYKERWNYDFPSELYHKIKKTKI